MIRYVLPFLLFWGVQASAVPSWFDQSHEIFLPAKVNALASTYRDYPIFWWNFLILEGQPQWEDLEAFCSRLSESSKVDIQKLPCHFDLKSLTAMTKDWVRDAPLRQDFGTAADFNRRLSETMTKASLPMGRDLLDILRLDPLNSLSDLKAKIERRMQLDFKLQHGFLVDEKSQQILIPIQFSFSPSESDRTQHFNATLANECRAIPSCRELSMFGPHASTRENEMQIRHDVETVSKVGMMALGLLVGFILLTGRYHVLSLLPLLLISIGLTVVVTVLTFGKIHGITLAFGPGIVGLAMDYGIHSCFLGPRSEKTWRANWVGLWTTLVILVILGMSAIPLLRQMMFFATFGLCLSFGLFYLVLRRWPTWFSAETYPFSPRSWSVLGGVALVLMGCSVLLVFQTLEFNIQQLNFESPKTRALREWFFKTTKAHSPYIVMEDAQDPLTSSSQTQEWTNRHRITYEGLATYLPPIATQKRHTDSWRTGLCPNSSSSSLVKAADSLFFKPFFVAIDCPNLMPNDLKVQIPDYVRDLQFGGQFISLLFPNSDAELELIHRELPQASTPREIFAAFPKIFLFELAWMVPLAFIGAFAFLWRHYRSWSHSLLALVPFFTGLGCYALVTFLWSLPISFISMIGLLMVFGCSIDYGVFVMDFLLFRDKQERGVWSALSICCFATLAGFAPLVFARHPVLSDLGHALLWGSLGTYLGSLWGVPSVYRFLRELRAP